MNPDAFFFCLRKLLKFTVYKKQFIHLSGYCETFSSIQKLSQKCYFQKSSLNFSVNFDRVKLPF